MSLPGVVTSQVRFASDVASWSAGRLWRLSWIVAGMVWMMPPQTKVDKILDRLQKASRAGGGWKALCPAHDDREPSLSINEGTDGRILIHCHAGCPTEIVLRALRMSFRDLFPKRR